MENNQPEKKKISSTKLAAKIMAIILAVLMAGGSCAIIIEIIANSLA